MVQVQIILGTEIIMIPEILEIIGMDLDSLGIVRGKECINNRWQVYFKRTKNVANW